MCDIMQTLSDDDIATDIAMDAAKYASMEYQVTSQMQSLPKIEYCVQYKCDNCLKKITKDLQRKLDKHYTTLARINSIIDLWERKKTVVRKAAEIAGNYTEERRVLTDEEIAKKRGERIRNAIRNAIKAKRTQRNQTLREWIKIFNDARETYAHNLYNDFTNRNRISADLRDEIETKYSKLRKSAKLQLEKAMEHNQSTKSDMYTATLSKFTIEKATKYKTEKYHLLYYVPQRNWYGTTRKEAVDKIKALNAEYIISLDPCLNHTARCIVAESIVPKQYALYNHRIGELRKEENTEKDANKIKQQMDQPSDPTNRKRVSADLKGQIETKYSKLRESAKLELEKAMAHSQSTKKDMFTEIATLSEFTMENETKYKAMKCRRHLQYHVRASKNKIPIPTGRIELHTWLLSGKKKLEYKIYRQSKTEYESASDNEPEMNEENRENLNVTDNVLLPEAFTMDAIKLNELKIQKITNKNTILLTAITADGALLYHPLQIQVSDSKLKINKDKTGKGFRKTTKLDYMEYMVEKFGSRAVLYHPHSAMLSFHTTYIMEDECKDALNLCDQIATKIQKSLYQKESKDFKFMSWECSVIGCDEDMNTERALKGNRFDAFIRNLIVQIPIQIARGTGNQFLLMYNGADDQSEYTKVGSIGSRSLCKAIRFSAYDGLIKSWEGKIKVVTSMGKQSTGKSYMLNHLFGTKFDISGGRCTDGAWLSARIVHETLYVICDFEGLGSFERSAQEDMLLATFNAAISNCTIFKCDNRFDRSIEDMFNKFQAGVKIMKGSENCFAGELMLIVKDVIDTGADAAVDDFMRHIERLAQSSQLVINDKGKKESPFFVYQMYKRGLAIIPYPPLANEAFFTELEETLHPNIAKMEPIHHGGKVFLDHIKLIMAKLNIGDYAAMTGEQAKIRAAELRENLQNAVETGSIIKPKSMEYGVTFQVDDDQNLLLLDGNKVITATPNEAIAQIKNYTQRIGEYLAIDDDIENSLIAMVESIHDSGIILGRFESLKFLWQQFSAKIERVHASFKESTNLFELFLDIIYHRRKLRVNKYIVDNTKKFEKKDKVEIDGLIQSAESRLNMMRDKMRICKSKCDDCFYPCLLCKNHEDDTEWADKHSCFQIKHSCKEVCEYCAKDGKSSPCDDKCGHSSKHNCGVENHTCGNDCSLRAYGGCQEKCDLESGHDKIKEPCKCNAETHYCNESCAVAVCHNTCKMPYNKEHEQHICIQSNCPYPCEVKCWNDALGEVANCSRPCNCNNHAHDLDIKSGECKDEGHICDREHPCPELCTEKGLCHVEVKKTIVKKETFIGGAGTKFEYDSYADVNAQRKRCYEKIPIGQFKHEGNEHKCYDKSKENVHTCDVACDACGYYCEKPYGHSLKHNGQHGNMRNTKFYAADTTVDTGDGRIYQIGDKGVAEICNMFCQRLGRGHTHLEFCKNHLENGEKCVELPNSGVRHQRKPYKPDEHKEKDEVQHNKFWSRKGWDDPCRVLCSDAILKSFDKCPYICAHPSHETKQKEKNDEKSKNDDEEEEEERKKYCTKGLWHKVCDDKNGCQCGTCHTFRCQHPFSKAHVIFVGGGGFM